MLVIQKAELPIQQFGLSEICLSIIIGTATDDEIPYRIDKLVGGQLATCDCSRTVFSISLNYTAASRFHSLMKVIFLFYCR